MQVMNEYQINLDKGIQYPEIVVREDKKKRAITPPFQFPINESKMGKKKSKM